ncbi:hypothetical protein, partial [Nitrospira sp. BLG_1]|uniref:hypothetical protein n=1 Tax=Nitrospira sp. BLG_1 TaxID=3395883 RepID=UPI0039BC7073
VLFAFEGQEFFPQIKGGLLQMHMRAPLGLRIEAAGRIASLVSNNIREMLPGNVDAVVSNCGLPVGAHNLAFIPQQHRTSFPGHRDSPHRPRRLPMISITLP